jgi:hypothetical protein
MKPDKDWFYLSAMVLAAILLRAPLVHTGLTIDDACTAFVVEAPSWPDMVERIRTIEMSPPLYFSVLRTVVGIFGLTTPVLALTSMFFSVAAIPFIYLLGKASVAKTTVEEDAKRASKVGLCAAFFATTSFLSILYGHEARTYALASFLFTLSLLLFLPFFDGKAGVARRLGLFFTTALTAYTHYTSIPYTGIMIIAALVFRKKGESRSLLAVPSMVAGLATIAPWYPVLKYHGGVGTPWADPTPWSKFLTVFASNISAVSPLPVVPSFLFVTLLAPILITLLAVMRPAFFGEKLRQLRQQPKLLTLLALLTYSVCVFGYITPYIFGYVRYMYPIAPTAWVLLAVVLVGLAEQLNRTEKIQAIGRRQKLGLVWALAAVTLAASAQTVLTAASQDRSGLRRLAADIAARRFGNAAYITSPDFVGIILVYYLKHECAVADGGLPNILGFAYPEGGLLPPKHEGRAACWQDPQLFSKYKGYLKKMEDSGATQVVLVRDTYSPDSKQIPTNQLTNKLEELLDQKLVRQGETITYAGSASTYKVTRFAFRGGHNANGAP